MKHEAFFLSLRWVAEYSNGQIICEKDKQTNYYSLDRQLLKSLKLVDEKGEAKATVISNDGEVLFYRIRTTQKGNVIVNRFYFLGWRKRENGVIKTHVTKLTSEGTIVEESDQFNSDYWAPQEQV